MKDSSLSAVLPFLLLCVCAFIAQVVQASTAISERGLADQDGRIKVDNVTGSLSIIGWERAEVEVSGELGDGAELRFEADGDRTLVSVRKRSGVRRMQPSHLIVHIPAGSELGANGVSAEIEVESMHGPQRLETVSGAIDAHLAALEIEATSVSGSIRIVGEGQIARIDASSVSGRIGVDNIAGEVNLNSVSGKLELNAGLLSRVGMNSTSGKVVAELDLAPNSRLQAETISGDIQLLFVDADNLQVDVETFSGRIDNCFDEQQQSRRKYGPGRTLRFERGAADRAVRVESLSGDVELCSVNQR